MTTILFPAGTTKIRYADLAHWIAKALHDDPLMYGAARINLQGELAQAVMRGTLILRDPLTLGPHPMPIGAMRDDAPVLLNDLRDFLKTRGISVEVEVEVEQTAQTEQAQPEPAPAPVPATAAQVEPVHVAPAEPGRILKKRVLVQNLQHRWPTIEADLKEASRNGLSAAAHRDKGWCEMSAEKWADQEGRLRGAASQINSGWPGMVHKMVG